MARESLTTSEILALNDKIDTFVLVSPDSTDEDDVELFVVKPPPAVQNAAHRASIQSMTNLCETCRTALEYCSYVCSIAKSDGEDAAEKLPTACLLYAGSEALRKNEEAGCHICVLVMSNLRTKRLSTGSIDQSNIEMCWQRTSDRQMPARIHFALTHNGHERSAANYWNFLKLKLWPCSEFGPSLFGVPVESEFVMSGSTASDLSQTRAVQWLSRCQANEDGQHAQCNQEPGDWLPTRLLDVDFAFETSKLRLVVPGENPQAFASDRRYITLSHCWGAWGATELPVLNTTNLTERQTDGLDLSLLPKTFKDALDIARWFQVRWLWIDSLCILQNSRNDWEQEAVMMYSVYRNALLNISADDSNDARWGCFRDREPLAVCPMCLQLPWMESDNSSYWLTPASETIFEGITNAPLAKRAWVFQERQLSRRVLHFTSSEMIWECCAEGQHFASEMFPEGGPFKTIFNNRPKFQSQSNLANSTSAELYKTWNMLCEAYSEKKLSHLVDKVMALSGLAQQFQAVLPKDAYVAGLWRSTFPESLLWTSSENCGRMETDVYIAPSWSWLSMDGQISTFASGDNAISLVDVLDVTTDLLIRSRPTALLRGASLDLRCYLRAVEIQPDYEKKPWYMMATGGGQRHTLIVKDGGQNLNLGSEQTFSFDMSSVGHAGPASVSCFFLLICIHQSSGSSAKVITGLLVEPVDDRLTTFRRIGTMRVRGSHCVGIAYRLKNSQEPKFWNSLDVLLKPTYESFDTLRKDIKSVSDDSSSLTSSPAINETQKEDLAVEDVVEANREPVADPGARDELVEKGVAGDEKRFTESMNSEGMGREILEGTRLELDISKEDGLVVEETPITMDLASMSALERLYAADTAFCGSELETYFERLVPQHITLI